jgi:hypothetical protein
MLNGLDKKYYTVPQAQLFFRPEGGEEFVNLGNASDVTVQVDNSNIDIKSNEGPVARTDERIPNENTVTVSLTLQQLSEFNRAASLSSRVKTRSRSSTSGNTKTVNGVKAGSIYFVGSHQISNVSVTDGSGSVEYTKGTDYEVDLGSGLLHVLQIPDTADSDIQITYDEDELTERFEAEVGADPQMNGELMIRSTQRYGPKGILVLHRVDLQPSDSRAFVSGDENASVSLEGQALRDQTKPEDRQFGYEMEL